MVRWENVPSEGGLSASDRRILLTCWVSEAKKRVDVKYYSLWRYFEKTGGLITVDGTNDSAIRPSKIPDGEDYSFMDEAAEAAENEEAAMHAAHACAERQKKKIARVERPSS
jgi:hypothetical protein